MTEHSLLPTDGADVVLTASIGGTTYDFRFGIVTNIEHTYSASVTQEPMMTFPPQRAFCFDSGVTHQISFDFTRTSPDTPDDTSSDSRAWSNQHWSAMLRTLMGQWQFRTDGYTLNLMPYGSAGDNMPVTSSRVYLNSVGIPLKGGNPQTISNSLSVLVGGYKIASPVVTYRTLTYHSQDGTDSQTVSVPQGTSVTVMAYPADWNQVSLQVCRGWTSTSGGTTVQYKAGASITINSNINLYSVWKTWSWSEKLFSNSANPYTFQVAGTTMIRVYALGGGGGGGGVGRRVDSAYSHSNVIRTGGGGGGPGFVSYMDVELPDSSASYTIEYSTGLGGAAGSTSNDSNSDGGDGGTGELTTASCNGQSITAMGGPGGTGGKMSSTPVTGPDGETWSLYAGGMGGNTDGVGSGGDGGSVMIETNGLGAIVNYVLNLGADGAGTSGGAGGEPMHATEELTTTITAELCGSGGGGGGATSLIAEILGETPGGYHLPVGGAGSTYSPTYPWDPISATPGLGGGGGGGNSKGSTGMLLVLGFTDS